MQIGSNMGPSLEKLPVEAQIDAELMSKELDQQKIEGSAAIKMIESAQALVNTPLKDGPVGRKINIRV
ncbi:MAG: hypothetical protein WCO71_05640 [Pseudomonadota bacterium]